MNDRNHEVELLWLEYWGQQMTPQSRLTTEKRKTSPQLGRRFAQLNHKKGMKLSEIAVAVRSPWVVGKVDANMRDD